jgi:hypothetical protein
MPGPRADILRAIAASEFDGARVAGSGTRKYLIWNNPVWRGEWKSVTRFRIDAASAFSPTSNVPGGPTKRRPKKITWEVIAWNARNFDAETSAHMASWLHERTTLDRRPGIICLTETWQHADVEMPILDGYSKVIARPRTKYGVNPKISGGVAVYIHDAIANIVTDTECVCDGNFEGGIVLKIRDCQRMRNEFVAVVYGEFSRAKAGIRVDRRRMLLTIDRWRNEVKGPMFVVGDQNLHANTEEMSQWNDTLHTERMDTGEVPSYIRLDDKKRGTAGEYTSTTDHVLRPVNKNGEPRSRLLRNPKVHCVDLGIGLQDHYPIVMDAAINSPAKAQRCKV